MARGLTFRFKEGEIVHCTIDVAKEKVLISCAVAAQLVCVFVFAYVISHETCHENHSIIIIWKAQGVPQ